MYVLFPGECFQHWAMVYRLFDGLLLISVEYENESNRPDLKSPLWVVKYLQLGHLRFDSAAAQHSQAHKIKQYENIVCKHCAALVVCSSQMTLAADAQFSDVGFYNKHFSAPAWLGIMSTVS